MQENKMIVIKNMNGIPVRYRMDDARRLGLIASGKVIAAGSERVRQIDVAKAAEAAKAANAAKAAEAAKAAKAAEAAEPAARPKKNGSREEWAEYATATGIPADQVDGKTRDEIIKAVDTAAGQED